MPNLAATRAPCPRPCFPVTCCLWSQFTLRKSKSHLLSPGKSGNGKGMALEQRSWECAVVCSFPEEHQVHICQYFKMLALLEPKLPLHRPSQRQAHLYPTVHPQSPPPPLGTHGSLGAYFYLVYGGYRGLSLPQPSSPALCGRFSQLPKLVFFN